MFGRVLSRWLTFVLMGTLGGSEKRVELDAGEKWSEAREPDDKTDIRGFMGWVYAMIIGRKNQFRTLDVVVDSLDDSKLRV